MSASIALTAGSIGPCLELFRIDQSPRPFATGRNDVASIVVVKPQTQIGGMPDVETAALFAP
jgi:hypothetical protein